MVRKDIGKGNTVGWPKISTKRIQPPNVHNLFSGDRILAIPGCLTPEESERVIETAERLGFQHQSSRGPAYGEAFRDNDRISVKDAQFAETLWQATGLKDYFTSEIDDRAIGLNDNIRIYRYSPGQRFGKHIDESVEVDGGYTLWTVLIYLSDPVGGETLFYKRNKVVASVTPKAGLALLHLHGAECLTHEGAAVKRGVKYVLRSDVVVKRRPGDIRFDVL